MQRAAGRAPASPVVPAACASSFLDLRQRPENITRAVPRRTFAPPALAPIAPRKARKPRDAADTMGLPGVKDRANGTSACWLRSSRPASLRRSSMGPRLRISRSPASPRPCRVHGRRKPVSATHRTGLARAETEIGKWRAETGVAKPPALT
jgi:hypothetical protein